MNNSSIIYLSHGGGPLPLLGDPSHQYMLEFMNELSFQLAKPKAVLVISAHWEASQPTLLGAVEPELLFDYYGFPEEAYSLNYKAPGNLSITQIIMNLLQKQGFSPALDSQRGFDHGVFIPMKMIFPKADVPIVPLSLVKGLDAHEHMKLGQALGKLAADNILVIGSGFSFRNMSHFSMDPDPARDLENDAFQDWLIETCTDEDVDRRNKRLEQWTLAPNARYCHPREEHLLPLHVCASIVKTPGKVIFDGPIAGKRALAFRWDV